MHFSRRTITAIAIALTLSTSAACSVTSTYSPVGPTTSILSVDEDTDTTFTRRSAKPSEEYKVTVDSAAYLTHAEATKGDGDH